MDCGAKLYPTRGGSWNSPEYQEWMLVRPGKPSKLLKISNKVFDQAGNLIIYTAQQWDSKWISVEDYNPAEEEPEPSTQITDDDIPF